MKKIISAYLAVVMICSLFVIPASADEKITLYVAENGNDENSGSVDSPLLTLEGAKEKLRALRGENTGIPAEVIFRGGTYRFKKGVSFSELDSGSEAGDVIYRAQDGEKVYFKGSMELDVNKGKPVSDENIKSRMYPEIAEKVVQFNLMEQGFPYRLSRMNKVRYSYPLGGEGSHQEYVNIYLNGAAQIIAQWPNGDDGFVKWVEVVEKGDVQGGTKGGAFRYTEDNPERWLNADNAWLGGYHGYDYQYERTSLGSIDVENKAIWLAHPAGSSVKSTESRRWKIFNLLEEIDSPGEWFIDYKTMILYYYPPYTLKDATLEIAYLDEHMINIENAEHITFSGIEFAETRRLGFYMKDVKNITVDKCNFTNMESNVIFIDGSEKAVTDSHWWQRQKINGSYNCSFTNCVFYNIGGTCFEMTGGNVDTLEKSNNRIENCVMTRTAVNDKHASVIIIRGCGTTVKNNNISNSSFHAITYFGNDHEISYNEIYDVNRATDDVGTIYCGRNYLHRGDVIAYNFVHDVEPILTQSRGFNPAIYWDDSASGQVAENNIIVNAFIGLYACGQVNTVKNNTIVNSKNLGLNITNGYQTEARMKRWQGDAASIANPELYYERYPNIDIGFNDYWGNKNAFNKVLGNLNVNAKDMRIDDCNYDWGTVEGNVVMEECNDFVNPEKLDYRIKSGSETAKEIPGLLTEEFDIEQIGVQSDITFNGETSPFRLVSPKNGAAGTDSTNLEFQWEHAKGANKYRLVIATDPELKNVVLSEETFYNRYTVPYLDGGKNYYWKVYAINSSREMAAEWESDTVPFLFSTALYSKVDTEKLDEEIKKAEVQLERIEETGQNGGFPEGTKIAYGKLIEEGKKLSNAKIGKVTQEQIDNKVEEIANYLLDKRISKPGYADLLDFVFDENVWVSPVTAHEDHVEIVGKKTPYNGVSMISEISSEAIFSFKAQIDTSGWVGLGLALTPGKVLYGAGNAGYFVAIKDSLIELQKNPSNQSIILETADLKVANDGKIHDFEFGVIKLGAGNLVLFKVDGETVFEYLDTDEDKVTKDLALCMSFGSNDNVKLYSQGNLPADSGYDELVEKYKQKTAEQIYSGYNTSENVVLMKIGCNAVVAPDKFDIKADSPPVIVNDKTLVPLRLVSEIFGAEVAWENDTAIIEKDGKRIEFKKGEESYTVNGERFEMSQAGIIINNRMMVPVREMSEALGKEVLWDGLTELIIIGDKVAVIQMNEKPLLNSTAEMLVMLSDSK